MYRESKAREREKLVVKGRGVEDGGGGGNGKRDGGRDGGVTGEVGARRCSVVPPKRGINKIIRRNGF